MLEPAQEVPICDGNKTPLTARVTAFAAHWLDERGAKPVETEVGVAAGWIADLAGVLVPTRTEAAELKLIPRVGSYGANYAARQDAREAAFKALPPVMSVLVEVKTSRGDFFGDRKWSIASPAHLSYIATPPDLVSMNELPEGWGWIVVGEVAKQRKPPTLFVRSDAELLGFIHAVAVRRDNVTRYARLRGLQRQRRAEESEERAGRRLCNLVDLVFEVIEGREELDEALRRRCLKLRDWERTVHDGRALQGASVRLAATGRHVPDPPQRLREHAERDRVLPRPAASAARGGTADDAERARGG